MLSNDLNFLFMGFGLGVIVFLIITEIIYETKEKKQYKSNIKEELLSEKKLNLIFFHIILNKSILEVIDNNPYILKDITSDRYKNTPSDNIKIFCDIGQMCNYVLSVVENREIGYDYLYLNGIVDGFFVQMRFEKTEEPKKEKTTTPCRRGEHCIYYVK